MSKRILITGATSGIGEATAQYLYSEGYDLVLTGRNKEKLAQFKEVMGDKAEIVHADLSDNAGVRDIFDLCQAKGLTLDGLVHSAGIAGVRPVKLCDAAYLASVMQLHYFAFMELCKFFYKRDFSNDGASIVAVSSIATCTCEQTFAPYACAKSAVDTAVTVMSKEFLKRKIRVNAIKPALTDTPFITKNEAALAYQPLGYIEPKYLAFMIEYLLSEKAKYITGAFIPISAGMEF